jgi:hypothetical protein
MFPTNLKKAILFGILMWFLLFIAGGIVMNTVGEDMIGKILIFVGPFISMPIAYWYLKTTPNPNMSKEGFKLGVCWAILAFFLDFVIMVFAFGLGFGYYRAWTLWVGYSEMIGFSTLLGYLMSRWGETKRT